MITKYTVLVTETHLFLVEDLQILSAFLESREARPVHRPVRAARTEQRVSMSSEGSGLEIAAIPDMGLEFGFGPPVLHGTYSHTDTPDASLDASAEPTDREHEPGVDEIEWLGVVLDVSLKLGMIWNKTQ